MQSIIGIDVLHKMDGAMFIVGIVFQLAIIEIEKFDRQMPLWHRRQQALNQVAIIFTDVSKRVVQIESDLSSFVKAEHERLGC